MFLPWKHWQKLLPLWYSLPFPFGLWEKISNTWIIFLFCFWFCFTLLKRLQYISSTIAIYFFSELFLFLPWKYWQKLLPLRYSLPFPFSLWEKESSFGTTSITMAGKAHWLSEALYSGALVNLLSSLLYFIQLLNTGRRRCFSTEFRD